MKIEDEKLSVEVLSPPKLFLSYRWSSPSHEEWVLRLAISLRTSGIDVRLDKWHLSEGQDTLSFMESMVSDPSVNKVLMICDKGYVDRANSKEGGVGTEAQIISAKVYNDTRQDKFAALVLELDELGNPILPTYMGTRLYFDMSSADAEAANFERIVRWTFGQPFHTAPPIGAKPDFLGKTYTTGSSLFQIRAGNNSSIPHANGNYDAEDVLQSILEESLSFYIDSPISQENVALVYKSIKEVRAVSENAYRALRKLIQTQGMVECVDKTHAFFEALIRYWDRPHGSRWSNDPYQYFVNDLLVSFVAICIEQKAFNIAADFLATPIFRQESTDPTGKAVDYSRFQAQTGSLESYGRSLNRASLHADLLNEGHEHSVVNQSAFMEAEITLHLRGLLAPHLRWYPVSALYLIDTYGILPTYAHAKSERFYNRLKPLLLNVDSSELRSRLGDWENNQESLRFNYWTLDVSRLIGVAELGTAA